MSKAPEQNPHGWVDSIAEFLSARAELIRFEARDAGRHAARSGVLAAVAILGIGLFWLLLLAGLIGLLAASSALAWYHYTLIAALLHLAAVVTAVILLKKPAPPTFPYTRRELEKDREWLNQLRTPNSKD